MNRIDRLSAILIQLQTKRIIKAEEIARRFEISTRTVYRDIRALEEAGIPIGAEAGRGYYLVDGYHLPPVMFTRDEAGAMLIAEKLINKLGDRSVNNQYISAINKIKAVLPDQDKEFLEDINKTIQVFYRPPADLEEFPNNFITRIQRALSESKCLEITYFSAHKQDISKRTIEPLGLCFYGFSWHLIAWCKLRKDYRDFRIDRLKNLDICEEKYCVDRKITLRDYFKMQWEKRDLFEAVVKFDKKTAMAIGNSKYYFGFVDQVESGDEIEMSFAVNSYSDLAYWLMSFGHLVQIVKPHDLKEEMKQMVANLAGIYLS